MEINIQKNIRKDVVFQDYSPGARIDGVFYHSLKKHRFLEGWFMEFMRFDQGKTEGLPVEFNTRQLSLTGIIPNRINAFHIHPRTIQDELWCVVQGTLMIWLVDLREHSKTAGVKQKCILSGENPSFLYIPSGIAHGYKSGKEQVLMFYAMNAQFNIEDPNEGRLPWDYFGKELWEEDRG